MQISIENKDNYVIITPEGKLDSVTSPELEEKITSLVNDNKSNLLINFEKLTYISSAGLRVILIAAKKTKVINGEVRLSSLSPMIKNVFNISGFSTLFKIFDTPAEAAF